MNFDDYFRQILKSDLAKLPDELLIRMFSTMLKIRYVEEEIAQLIENGEIICPCHLYTGQEAVAAGVCLSLNKDDYVFSTHRSHGHYIAKGGDLNAMLAEIFGKATGCSSGHGGSMHLVATNVGFMGSSAIVGGSIPLAVGSALAFGQGSSHRVSVAFFGDGAATEGVLYEALNFAQLKKLPVIFICENNFYSTHMHISEIQSNVDLYKKAEAFNVRAVRIDGNNVIEVHNAAENAVERARSGNGPSFIECITYRWRGHVGSNNDLDKGLRNPEELDWWTDNCPIKRMEEALTANSIMSPDEKDAILSRIRNDVKEAILYAKQSPLPDDLDSRDKVYK